MLKYFSVLVTNVIRWGSHDWPTCRQQLVYSAMYRVHVLKYAKIVKGPNPSNTCLLSHKIS